MFGSGGGGGVVAWLLINVLMLQTTTLFKKSVELSVYIHIIIIVTWIYTHTKNIANQRNFQ